MQLVYIEGAKQDTDARLTFLLEARQRAVQHYTEACTVVSGVTASLQGHLSQRLKDGATGEELRKELKAGGVSPSVCSRLLCAVDAGRLPKQYTRPDPRQQDMFVG